ncbi:MAG: hypothetical protein L3J33_07205 [Rhodobacteraceae bacterium]|nr:hypothetical protein [Paracoccaceae bacterium]
MKNRLSGAYWRFLLVHVLVFAALLGFLAGLPAKAEPILLSNNFEIGAAKAFERQLTEEIDTVILAVSGGYLAEGIEIGRIIRARGLKTVVPSGAACLSACAEAFLGGTSMQIDGTVAFHIPRTARVLSQDDAFTQGLAGGTLTAIYRFEMGFGFELTRTINRWTTNDRLLAFDTTAELLLYQDPDSGLKLPRFYER